MGWRCITKSPVGKAKLPKGHVPQYMISRAFIPPWSLVMRDRKLLDQTLLLKAAGTLVSLLERFLTKYYFARPKSRFLKTHRILNISLPWPARRQSDSGASVSSSVKGLPLAPLFAHRDDATIGAGWPFFASSL